MPGPELRSSQHPHLITSTMRMRASLLLRCHLQDALGLPDQDVHRHEDEANQ
jgi:hypothetical protein